MTEVKKTSKENMRRKTDKYVIAFSRSPQREKRESRE